MNLANCQRNPVWRSIEADVKALTGHENHPWSALGQHPTNPDSGMGRNQSAEGLGAGSLHQEFICGQIFDLPGGHSSELGNHSDPAFHHAH
jgi:hypothetical protein